MIKNKFLRCLILALLISFPLLFYGQLCPIFDKRNNGQGTSGCLSETPPAGKIKSGQFDFTNLSTSTTYTVDSILLNGQLYQKGSLLYNGLGTVWFGGYNGSSKTICFYGNNVNDNTPPAGRWAFYFKNNGNQTVCSYTLTASGTLSSFSPGSISSDQTICSGETPTALSNSTSPTGCSGTVNYKWQQSTTSINSGFLDISNATSTSYSPVALNTTTYFRRIDSCSDGASVNTNTITVTVISAGTLTGTQTVSVSSNVTFASNGTTGGSWSSSNSSIATVSSSGVVSGVSIGSATITYSVTSGSKTCTSSRVINVTNPLPVTWLNVDAICQNDGIQLTWSTSYEANNSHYLIEKYITSSEWVVVGRVSSQGNGNGIQRYQYTDYSFTDAPYRIRQVDIDGKSTFSKVVKANCFDKINSIHLFPNPTKGSININLVSTYFDYRIVNSSGSTVKFGKIFSPNSVLDLSNLPNGIYTLIANSPGAICQFKKIYISK
jgi:hypothetical protein